MKVAVLSFAHVHAGGYLQQLSEIDGVEVLASDPERESAAPGEVRGAAFAADFPGVTYLDSYADVFAMAPDAVVICSENVHHRRLTELAAGHGADVLCEKPLATSVADAEAMVATCRAAGVALKVAYPVRFSPAYAGVRAHVVDGGKLLAAVGSNNGAMPTGARAWFADPHLAGGGALIDHTVHLADLMDHLLDGETPVRVHAQVNNLLYPDEVDVETAGLVTVEYAGGAVATFDCSWSHPRSHPSWGGLELEVVTERAHVVMDAFDQRIPGFSETRSTRLEVDYGANLDALMLRAFLFGPPPGSPDVADGAGSGLRTVRVVEAAYESARTGVAITLEGAQTA